METDELQQSIAGRSYQKYLERNMYGTTIKNKVKLKNVNNGKYKLKTKIGERNNENNKFRKMLYKSQERTHNTPI